MGSRVGGRRSVSRHALTSSLSLRTAKPVACAGSFRNISKAESGFGAAFGFGPGICFGTSLEALGEDLGFGVPLEALRLDLGFGEFPFGQDFLVTAFAFGGEGLALEGGGWRGAARGGAGEGGGGEAEEDGLEGGSRL